MYQIDLSKKNPVRETEKVIRNNPPAQMGSGLPRQSKSLYSPLQFMENAPTRNVPAKQDQTEPVIQRLMTLNQFVGQTTPRFGARGRNNGVYYNQIDPLLQEYETAGLRDERRYIILQTLHNIVNQWTAARPNSTRADVRNVLLQDVTQEINATDQRVLAIYTQAQIWRQTDAGNNFTAANIVFVSRNVNGNVGSIYFNNGRRIRLTHDHGPEVSHNQVDARYCLPEQDADAIQQQYRLIRVGRTLAQIQAFLNANGAVPAVAGVGGRLFELSNGGQGSHLSRGGPEDLGIALTDASVNLLFHAASTHDNDTLRASMAIDPDGLLNQIPVN